MKIRIRIEGRAVMVERKFKDESSSTVVMPVANAGLAMVKGKQLGTLFGLKQVNETTWENE